MFALFKVTTGIDLLNLNEGKDQTEMATENTQYEEDGSLNVVFDEFEEIEVDCSEIGTTNEVKPKTVLMRGLLRSHGLETLKRPYPELLRRDLILEAASLQKDSKRIKDFSDIELQDLSIFLSLVGKEKDDPLLKLGRTEIALELQKRSEKESHVQTVQITRQPSPPIQLPKKKDVAAFNSLRITDNKIKDLIKRGTRPSHDLFKLPGRLNEHGFPSSNFTSYLVVTYEMVCKLNVRPKAVTMAKAAVSSFNALLHNDKRSATIPSRYFVVPVNTFKDEATNLAKMMMCLVARNVGDCSPNRRQKVIKRLQMEVKSRGLVTLSYLTACAVRLEESETLDFYQMKSLLDELKKAIGGLHHLVYLNENFY
ncbi:hypothetical protein ACHWQZ_G008367 [Mnemiopsis leidyi]